MEDLTKQQTDILKILDTKIKIQAKDVAEEYEKQHSKKPGNAYETLNRLVQTGFVKRIDKGEYAITAEGKAYLQKKPAEQASIYPKEDIDAFKKFATKPDFFKNITSLFAPHLLGLEKEKLACLLGMISQPDEGPDRQRINVLYQGEPGSGKTSIIKTAYRDLWGFYADSDATSSALKGTGSGYQVTSGLLKQADNNTVFIDEIDKMSKEDQTALLGAIECGFFTVNKDKCINKKVDARIRCVATCNDAQRIKPELLDRFDLTFDIKKLTPEEKVGMLRAKINDWGRSRDVDDEGPGFLKKYLTYAKTTKTTLPADRGEISKLITTEMDNGVLAGKDVRKIEAAIRLIIAIAKIQLKTEATVEDVKKTLELFER